MKRFFIIIIALLLMGTVSNAQKIKSSNTAKYSGRVAIFYGPSQTEYDSLAKDEDSGIDEVISDFHAYTKKIEPYLNRWNIKLQMTSAQVIQVSYPGKTKKYYRSKLAEIVGVILSDGLKKPKVDCGVMTDTDLKVILKEYFQLKE